ncbi:membrane protein [Beutenbergia cavernae DSM 12333]|uniref:Membrane protein n=1 Tax=Beutenbergia cavernae (strain ATCC BAA-8 / DSM 12333 / CCUG 43141 / JCM 11478 / NBRC 16432 / NCIMB 13614 / HKI 0122) TaxID=471853 RepID=C5C5P9_BEUC1|nr:PrsW family intramembrane metalloprotease [Beutenbergia cavernae]ACQ80240.1 membrane protein [Beutenbergia cavernae DSM 12333]
MSNPYPDPSRPQPYPPGHQQPQPGPAPQQPYPQQAPAQPQPTYGQPGAYPQQPAPSAYPSPVRPGRYQGGGPQPGQYAPNQYRPGQYAAPPSNPTAQLNQVWQGGVRKKSTSVWSVIAIVLVAIGALVGLGLVLIQVGVGPAVVGFILALFPLAVVLTAVFWLDRWEPEPKGMLAFALLWGAGVSVIIALFGNTALGIYFYSLSGDPAAADTLTAVISAPIVEESAKGLGVLLIYLMRRQFFDGIVDGIVYAAVVAAGFAFTENILYFGRFFDDGLGQVFVMRGIMSPFAHLLFTACIGIALGIASRSRNRYAAWWLFPLGLLAAMGLHALWNGAASLNFILIYVVVQVPLFVGAIVLAFWLRRQESRVIRDRLTEYGRAGWFEPHEVEMLASLRLRSQARTWAGRMGPSAVAAMKAFQKHATSLAFARQRVVTGRADLRTQSQDERSLLNELTSDRQRFVASASPYPMR